MYINIAKRLLILTDLVGLSLFYKSFIIESSSLEILFSQIFSSSLLLLFSIVVNKIISFWFLKDYIVFLQCHFVPLLLYLENNIQII